MRREPPMIIDCFAGGGGASTGIELALGRSPDVAINHSEAALALHAANHPDTHHLDSNIWDVDPASVTHGRKVGLVWASPDCKHFSKAKGASVRDRNIRDLAWVVHRWARLPRDQRPDVILLENVEEFITWGPVGEDGQPIKEFAGQTFELWARQLRDLGYKVQWRELRACDYGAPTIRKRLLIVARCDGRPIVWPKPTHGDPKSAAVRKGKLSPWRTAAECIDWSLPCPSIFDTKAEIKAKLNMTAVRPLAENTLARIARGMARYVLGQDRPFLVNLTHGGRIEDAAEPIRTITAAHRGEKAIIAPLMATMRNSQKPWQGCDEPAHTITAGGAGLTLIAPSITRFNSGATGSALDAPTPTVTANSYIKRPGGAAPLGVLAPILAGCGGRAAQSRPRGINEPCATITAKADTIIAAPFLASLKGTARRDSLITAPHPTILAGGGHSAMIAPILTYAQHGGANRSVSDPHHTICANTKDQNSVIAATMVQTGYGERKGQAPRALDIAQPLGTVVAGGAKHAPIAAFLAQQNGGSRMGAHAGHDPRDPLSTVAASGSHQTPIAAFFAKYYGTGDGAPTDDPMHTVTVRDRFSHVQAGLAAPPFGPEHHARARQVAEFLRAHGAWDGGEFITLTVNGADYVVIDIGMRMLTPRELFNAQGFPDDYVIEGVWDDPTGPDPKWHPFSKSVQVSCCGNSVCPPLAEALARANAGHLAVRHIKTLEQSS